MKNPVILLLSAIAIFSCSAKKDANKNISSSDTIDEWIVLFDGSSTGHFRGFHKESFPDSGWAVVDKELVNDGSGRGGLITKDQYADFIFEWEWRLLDEGGNSGIKYFVKENPDKEGNYAYGLEYQMLDDEKHEWMLQGKMQPNDYHTTGALYEFFTPAAEKKVKPLGEFNRSKIISNGSHVEHWLNGIKVVEYARGGPEFMEMKAKSKFKDRPEFGLHKEGHIVLQDHQSRVGFRNMRIRVLEENQE
jgi:hypothetical protein